MLRLILLVQPVALIVALVVVVGFLARELETSRFWKLW